LHQASRQAAHFVTWIPSFLASLSTSFFLVSFGNLTKGKLAYNKMATGSNFLLLVGLNIEFNQVEIPNISQNL
jgi:hypothetical protein